MSEYFKTEYTTLYNGNCMEIMNELEQTKKVLDVIANLINEKETCTYRHLIYDLLEFKEDAYSELISGLTITNFLVYVKEQDKEIKRLKEEYVILQNASDEVEEEKDREIERLNNIIEKAINYIDDNTYYKDHKGHINIDDLYIILKGSDKE